MTEQHSGLEPTLIDDVIGRAIDADRHTRQPDLFLGRADLVITDTGLVDLAPDE